MRLTTNLSFVQLKVNGQSLRLDCKALLFEEREGLFDSSRQQLVRGLGYSSSWPIFTLWLNCGHLDYEMTPAANNQFVMISDAHPEGLPIFSGADVTFSDGTQLYLQVQDPDRPIDVSDHESSEDAHAAFEKKVRDYHVAPFFPVLNYVPLAFA